jgi:hypothetical protein
MTDITAFRVSIASRLTRPRLLLPIESVSRVAAELASGVPYAASRAEVPMHHARVVVLVSCALAGAIACAHSAPEPDQSSVVETTAAVTEPQASLDQVAARVAGQICAREVQCHADATLAEPCFRSNLDRAHVELARWRCAPAAFRARLEECLASIRVEPCISLDLATRRSLCAANDMCPDPDARIIPPGRALADAGI